MKWISSLKISNSFTTAVREAADEIKKELGSAEADFGLIFMSHPYRQEIVDSWPTLRRELPIKNIIGCTGGGVIGGGHEVEDGLAVSLTVAQLPDVTTQVFDVRQENLPNSDGSPKPWRDLVKAAPDLNPHFIVLSDPFSMDPDTLVAGLDFAFPSAVKIGGLVSGGAGPKENLLISNEKILYKGAVGACLFGDLNVETVVAQGCRPIGKPLTISNSKNNILYALNNQTPLKALTEIYDTLNPKDQELLKTSLFFGIVMDPFITSPKQGDYLIRNILGLDQEQGFLAIGSPLRPGQIVQFHLRDAATSHDDLQTLLNQSQPAKYKNLFSNGSSETGAVLFSCMGRGQRLYGESNHDIGLVKAVVGNIPVGGFFCNGEIGPVGGKTYLHGYTSSIAFFSPTKPAAKTPAFAKEETTGL